MIERDQLEKAINLLETQRDELGDDVVETALAPLRARLAALNGQYNEPFIESRSDEDSADEHNTALFDGERRVVTILFCDVQGSTAMAEKLDPETWAQTIQHAL